MKKGKILKVVLSFLFVFSFIFTSCEVGMGKAVDLEAPYLTITSPEKFSYQPLQFVLKGKCTDNVGVKEVKITNKESGKLYGYATITEDEWQFDITLPKEEEGEITFLCAAYDDFGNCATKSARNITLLVDEHAPEGSGWYVERGNHKPTNLKDKEVLEDLDYTLSVNKDIPQNEVVYLHASFYDAMNIDTITIKLYEDEGQTPVLEKTVTARPEDFNNFIGEGKSMYSPVFTFTHSEFAAKGLGSGKHYMRVKYYSKDNDSADNYNESEGDTEAYFLWWPESDKPNFQVNNIQNGELTVSVGSSIPLDIFDDDGLSEYYAALTETSVNYTEDQMISDASKRTAVFGGTSTEDHPIIKRTSFSNKVTQQDSPSITAPGTPTQMYLYIAAKDAKENGEEKWNCRKVSVKVTDTSKPLLFIESPQQNTVPDIVSGTDSTFKITGYSLDTKGSSFVKIIYIPDDPVNADNNTSEKKTERAKALFTQYENDTTAKKVISGTNEVIWHTTLGAKQNADGGWKKQLFEVSMDLASDFKNKNNASTANETKYFEIFLRDEDNNDVDKSFIILGDNLAPGITITKPNRELAVHNYETTDLEIEFMASKESGLGIDTSSYKVSTKIGTQTIEWTPTDNTNKITINATTKVGTITIPKAKLKTWIATESQPTFTFYAKDKLGNGGKGEAQRTVILSTNPTPVSITVDNGEGTYIKGNILKFKVNFTKQVKVTGIPKLRLKYKASDTTYQYATYESGSGSNTLQFTFTVPEGAESNKLLCTGFDTTSENVLSGGAKIQATELGENDIFTSMNGVSIFSDTKTIKLDAVAPKISNITVAAADGNNYCTKDKVIRATVKFSKPVRIEGTPTLILKGGSTNISFAFENWNEDEIVFKHVVTTSDPQDTIKWAASYAFSSSGTNADILKIKDTPGNTLVLTGGATGTSSVVIDYTAPTSAPTITPAAGTYNEAKTIALSDIETNGTGYFSRDGGISWIKYSTATTEQKTLGNGSYELMTYQEDKAGNKSANSSKQAVTINNLFPGVINFGIDLPDGYYKAGTTIKFTIDFNDKIKVSAATDLKLTFASNANASVTVPEPLNLASVPAGGEASRFEFSYTTTGTDFYDGVVVTEILFADSVEDTYGNKPAFTTTPKILTPTNCPILNSTAGGKRTGVVLDGVAPTISTYSPENGAISSITNNANFKVTLTFDEDVFKETGYIILQRKGDWAIPAVMTNDEFLKYYNKMSAANKAIVRKMGSDGDDLKHGRTGIEVGPYRRITHGLKVDGSNYVPDTDTKFVLAYDLDLYSGSASLNDGTDSGTFTVTVAQIRSALESVGYHQHKVDVASDYVTVTGNKVEITFSEAIEDGREWELIIPETAFRDNAENFFAGIDEGDYSFWSNNVAKPVVRVDRYTHGWGAHEPNSDGSSYTDITENQGKYTNANPAENTSAAIPPTGYCRARIDCETPGVTIKYSKLGINGTAWTTTPPAGLAYNANGGTEYRFDNDGIAQTNGANRYTRQIQGDITTTNLNKRGVTTYTANSDIIVGDGNYTAARKDYITAYATKTGFTDSVNGYEGIFKTIVYYTAGSATRIINIEGGTAPGGQSCVFGFPLKDATDENDPTNAGRYSKNAYAVNGNTRTQWAFVSYEIISKDWAILLCNANHSRIYPLNSYGCATYITAMNYW